MRDIDKYIKSTNGWDEVPFFPEVINLLRGDGINVQASVKEAGTRFSQVFAKKTDKVIHVSIGPLRGCRKDLTDEEHAAFLLKETPRIFAQLFVGNKFHRMPCDTRKPDINHYYSEPVK